MRRIFTLTLLAALAAGCGSLSRDLGPWVRMEARQVAVPIAAGRVVVEVRDLEEGWVERVEVGDAGLPVEPRPTEPAVTPGDGIEKAMRAETGPVALADAPALDRALALAVWTAKRTFGKRDGEERAEGAFPIPSEDAREVLASVDRGDKFNCRSLATVFAAAARAHGLRVRRVDLAVRHHSPNEGHSVAEVWSPEHGKWVLVDPWFGVRYEVDGRAAGSLDVHRAVAARRLDAIRIVRIEGANAVDPWKTKIDPLLYFRNIYVRLDSGGWLRFVDSATRATPVAEVNIVQTDSEQAFAAEGDPFSVAPLRRSSSHGRVAFQAVGGRLCVCLADGLFHYGRFEVRVTRGLDPEFAGDVAPHDPEDRLLVAADEIVPEPRPADADGDRLPDRWSVEGAPAKVETSAEGVVVEAGDGACSLELPVEFAGDAPVIAFSRLRVDAGRVRFGVHVRRDAGIYVAEPGPPTLVSSIVTPGKRPPILVRFDLEPHTRCAIEWVSLRRALRLGDVSAGSREDLGKT